jgi:hypothetical protein
MNISNHSPAIRFEDGRIGDVVILSGIFIAYSISEHHIGLIRPVE